MPKTHKKKKTRQTQNEAASVSQSLSQSILEDVKEYYVKKGGLQDIAKCVTVPKEIIYPRDKVTVMIIGNHSAGKSSFVNWYVDENVRDTGTAIETKGFTIVTYGKRKSEPIQGEGCLDYIPHLKKLREVGGPGLMKQLVCLSSVSQSKSFPMVDFIDTPGLVDGGMEYGFDVNDAIMEIANHVDLILIFLDPHGMALCTRTMEVVEMLNDPKRELHAKVKYYLTKVDTIESETDRRKVSNQVMLNLLPRIKNTHGFELPMIFLPNPDVSPELAKINQISTKLCADIVLEIKEKVQKNMQRLKDDSSLLRTIISQELADEAAMRSKASSKRCRGYVFGFCAWVLVPLVAFMFTLTSVKKHLPDDIATHEHVLLMEKPAQRVNEMFPEATLTHIAGALGLTFLSLLILNKLFHASANKFKVRSHKEIQALKKHDKELAKVIAKRNELHKKWLDSTFVMENMMA